MQYYKGPYLYLRRRGPKPALWIIRDGQRQIGAGAAENDMARAEAALKAYAKSKGVAPYTGAPMVEERFGTIYFVSTSEVENFPIKIGITLDATAVRLKAVQGGCPYLLEVLTTLPGSYTTEALIHRKFMRSRLRFEWFSRSPELMRFIADIQAGLSVDVFPEMVSP